MSDHEHHDHAPHAHEGHEPHVHERYADRVHPEFVVLEIGDGVGALIVHTPPELHGVEIEISQTRTDDQRQHKDVLERPLAGESRFSAVFDQIPEGPYTLWVDDEARAREVHVRDGEVAELDWRLRSRASDPVMPTIVGWDHVGASPRSSSCSCSSCRARRSGGPGSPRPASVISRAASR
ncbi:MAG: hypothetical protein ABI317_00585 [Gaiellales bacterium]